MAGLEFIWHGMEDLEKAFVRVGAQVDAAAKANVAIAAATLIRDAQNNFQDGKKGDVHKASGEKPFAITGNLRRSIMADSMNHYGMGIYSQQVGPTMKYGRRVELGLAPTGPYPYFGPAAAKVRAEMAAIATANWARFIKF